MTFGEVGMIASESQRRARLHWCCRLMKFVNSVEVDQCPSPGNRATVLSIHAVWELSDCKRIGIRTYRR